MDDRPGTHLDAIGRAGIRFLDYVMHRRGELDIPTIKDYTLARILWEVRCESLQQCCAASDRPDVVFALWGCYELSHSLKPDYSLTVLDVFERAALLVIEQQADLRILSFRSDWFATDLETTDGLPSWVPDWSQPSLRKQILPAYDHWARRNYISSNGYRHHPALSTSRQLRVKGRVIAHITHVCAVPLDGCAELVYTNVPDCVPFDAIRRDLMQYMPLIKGRLTDRRIWHAVTCEMPSPYLRSSKVGRRLKKATAAYNWRLYKRRQLSHLYFFGPDGSLVHEGATRYIEGEVIAPDSTEVCQHLGWYHRQSSELADLLACTELRRSALIDDGHLALVPSDANTGDPIAIIQGCDMPMIIRHIGDDDYRLVEEAFVEGTTLGERVDWTQEEGQSIVLI
ncbi:hypothetical protein LTR37_013960 [Vermiconidia calcicola]|uniref:Uncharacterized protein n=1 Tax=Vermiconidia calcicola TaxID=1690605 RepID=A0ACC3MV94_9PEZI|nr:hypothetical protein LTR37_013960 [Vermiconidia calcicola]